MFRQFFWCLPVAAYLLSCTTAYSGGPLNSAYGRCVIYAPTSFPLPYMVDQGNLGTIPNAQATAIVESCFAIWQSVPTAHVSFVNAGQLPEDVTGENVFAYFSDTDGINPILFDSDGSIIDAVFGIGANNNVIGFAGSEYDTSTGFYTEGIAVLNGKFSEVFSAVQFQATFVHEFGHFIGLDHCQINKQFARDNNTSNDIYIPTMFPTSADDDTALASLNPDDMAALTLLYPAKPEVVNSVYGKIEGTVRWHNGLPVLGANVVAYKIDDQYMNRFSSVSDYYQQHTGQFQMLVPPGIYRLYVEPISLSFTGGSSVGPYATTPLSPSFTRPVRVTLYDHEISVAAGEVVGDITIIARPAQGVTLCPAELALGNDDPATEMLRLFRDRILMETHQGRKYRELYETHAPEISSILLSNQRLRRSCRRSGYLLARKLPGLMKNPDICDDPELRQAIIEIMHELAAAASPALQHTITNLILEKRDPLSILTDLIMTSIKNRRIGH